MKLILRLVAGLILLIAVFMGIGMFLPREITVERSIEIEAPAADVYPLVANLAANADWSPWVDLDPDTQWTYNDVPEGVGAVMEWASDDPQVGTGRMEITQAVENEALTVALDFGDMGTGTAQWSFTGEGSSTTATWGLVADMGAGPIGRWIGLKMDDWVGADYERGLARLKDLAEGGS